MNATKPNKSISVKKRYTRHMHKFRHSCVSCIFFWLKCSCSALLRSLFSIYFVFLRKRVQTSQKQKYRGMVYYLIKKDMQKFRHFWMKKKLPKKVTYVPLAPSHSIVYYCSFSCWWHVWIFYFRDTGAPSIGYSTYIHTPVELWTIQTIAFVYSVSNW